MRRFKAVICALFGHSRLVTNCMGYKDCARCGERLGDVIAGAGLPTGPGGYYQIGQRCQCEQCRQSFDTLRWIDRFLCPEARWPI